MKFYPLDRLVHSAQDLSKRWKSGLISDFQAYSELIGDYPDAMHQLGSIKACAPDTEDMVNALIDIHMKEL